MIEQRKTVSIVFADLVESTALAESVDVERLAGILSSYFHALRSAIEERGGTVEKFIGDAVVGVFGVPALHEDDALRAVKAALAMKMAIAELNDELGMHGDVNLAVRIGVNTGEVAVTETGTLGHAISIAARLEQAAHPGEILIGADTYALAGASLEATPIEPLAVKGSRVPLDAWRVTGLLMAAPSLSAGRAFIGREEELAAIGSALESTIRDSQVIRLTVVAPPGLGKSRLIAEALTRAPTESRILIGRCPSYGEGPAYAPLAEMITQLTATSGSGALDEILTGQPDASTVAAVVRATVQSSGPVAADETAWAFRRLFESMAKRQPLIVVVEDLHWADPLLLELLEYVASTAKMSPILMLCAARPDQVAGSELWAASSVRSVLVGLKPLTTDETETLLASFVGNLMDTDLKERIVATSGGVPLFVEQMSAFESEHSSKDSSTRGVPPTIRALLAARVDRLNPQERSILEGGAIEGQTFRLSTLLELLPDAQSPDLTLSLASLADREFIRSERTGAGTDNAFAFSHALMREAVYDAVPRRRRAELHERYGNKIEESEALPEIVGYHLASAYQERVALGEGDAASSLAIRAGRAFHEAGRNSVARREPRRSIDLLKRSEEILRPHRREWLEAVPTLISTLVDFPDYAAADALHEQAVATARELGDRTAELRSEIAHALSGYSRGEPGWLTSAIELADQAIDHFESVGADADIVDALVVKGYAESITSQVALIKTMQMARLHAQRINDEAVSILMWDALGGAMLLGDTPYSQVADYVDEEIQWAEDHGVAFTLIDARLSLAYIQAGEGQFDAARESLSLIRERLADLPGGARITHYGESFMLSGQIERDAGDPEAAAQAYRRAMKVFAESRPWQRAALCNLVHALVDLGRLDEARGLLDTLETDLNATGNPAGSERLGAEARLLSATGDIASAITLARRAVKQVVLGDLINSGRSHELLGGLILTSGDRDEALVELGLALADYSRKEYVPGRIRVENTIARSMLTPRE